MYINTKCIEFHMDMMTFHWNNYQQSDMHCMVSCVCSVPIYTLYSLPYGRSKPDNESCCHALPIDLYSRNTITTSMKESVWVHGFVWMAKIYQGKTKAQQRERIPESSSISVMVHAGIPVKGGRSMGMGTRKDFVLQALVWGRGSR